MCKLRCLACIYIYIHTYIHRWSAMSLVYLLQSKKSKWTSSTCGDSVILPEVVRPLVSSLYNLIEKKPPLNLIHALSSRTLYYSNVTGPFIKWNFSLWPLLYQAWDQEPQEEALITVRYLNHLAILVTTGVICWKRKQL